MYPRTEDNLCSNCECEVCVCNQYQPTGEIKEGASTKLRYLTKNFIPEWPKQRRIVPAKLYRYIVEKRDKHIYARCASELVISDDMVSEIEYFLRDGGAEIDGRDIHELVDELLQSSDIKNEWYILISA